MNDLSTRLEALSDLSKDELGALESEILTEFDAFQTEELTPEIVDKLDALATAAEKVRGEREARVRQEEELAARAAEAAARAHGETSTETSEDSSSELMSDDMTGEENEDEEDEEDEEEQPAPVMSNESAEETEAANADTAPEAEASESTEPEQELAADAETETESAETELAADEASAETTTESEAESSEQELASEAEGAVEDTPETELSTGSEDNAPEEGTVTVTAASGNSSGSPAVVVEPPADRRPTIRTAEAPVSIVAGADIPGISAGTSLNSMHDVAVAMNKRLQTIRRVTGGDGEQHVVASIETAYPEDRQLGTDPTETWSKIQKVASPAAITAAAGVCAPLEVRYDLFEIPSSDARPVRDSLARFSADRGGIRWVPGPVLSDDYSGALGIMAGDGTISDASGAPISAGDGPKPCLTITCPPEESATIDAVSLCLTFGNLQSRTYPELVQRNNELALVAHARLAENRLLNAIATSGTAVAVAGAPVATTGVDGPVGFSRVFLAGLDNIIAAFNWRHRLTGNIPMRIILPQWVKNLVRMDLVHQMPGDGLDVFVLADSLFDSWLRARNVNATYHLDDTYTQAGAVNALFTAASAGPVYAASGTPDAPDVLEFDLFPEGTFLFLDQGTLDLGVIRDSTLVGTNDYMTFVETFEGLAMLGPESIHGSVPVNADYFGAARDLVGTVASAV